jgi:hypothetical protein
MFRGSCLCRTVQYECSAPLGPFELCHCSRCRKATGSAFAALISVSRSNFRLLSGLDSIHVYEASVREKPPGYRSSFCSRCGSPVPDVHSESPMLDIPAGTLDHDPGVEPDKHIFVELRAPWFAISDALPQFTKEQLALHRAGAAGV